MENWWVVKQVFLQCSLLQTSLLNLIILRVDWDQSIKSLNNQLHLEIFDIKEVKWTSELSFIQVVPMPYQISLELVGAKQGSWLTASSTGHELPWNCALWWFDIIMSDEWARRRVCIIMFNCESKRPLKWIVMSLKPDIML